MVVVPLLGFYSGLGSRQVVQHVRVRPVLLIVPLVVFDGGTASDGSAAALRPPGVPVWQQLAGSYVGIRMTRWQLRRAARLSISHLWN